MLKNYTVTEKGSEQLFAVVQNIDPTDITHKNLRLINKVGQAIEDEFGYEDNCKILHDSIVETDDCGIPVIYMSFKYNGDDIEDDEEIREVELREVTIY